MSMQGGSRWGAKVGMAAVLVLGSAGLALADGGNLDATFGNGGSLTTPANGYAPGVALAPDGKVVVVGARVLPPASTGARSAWLIRRFDTGGIPDPTFGVDGEVALFGTGPDGASRVAVDGLGRVVVVGTVTTYATSRRSVVATSTLRVVRLTSFGTLDGSFGSGGAVQLTPPGGASIGSTPAGAVLVQADGRIVVAASAPFALDKRTTQGRPYLARLLDQGALDLSFGAGGFSVETRLGQSAGAKSVVRQASGHYAVAQRGTDAWIVTRHLPNGGVDAGFAPDLRSGSYIGGIAVDGSDRILATGRNTFPNGDFDVQVVRYDPTGAPDVSFGVSGVALVHLMARQNTWADPVVDPLDGGILIPTNLVSTGAGCAPVRLHVDGVLDATWGVGGVGQSVAGNATGQVNATGLVRMGDGRLVLAGQVATQPEGWNWVLARYLSE